MEGETNPTSADTPQSRLELSRRAWDAYHPAYMDYNLRDRPDFYEFFANGGNVLSELATELAGDVTGVDLLDICCAGDAKQSFSWANLGARVTGSDISEVAIDMARANAERMGLSVHFEVADAQVLEPFPDNSFDLVYATYCCWLEDIARAARSWRRVLRPAGCLLYLGPVPLVDCLNKEADGRYRVGRNYGDCAPRHSEFRGTPIADKYGGWDGGVDIVEYFHSLPSIINAIASAGFRIARLEERGDPEDAEGLPRRMGIVATKG